MLNSVKRLTNVSRELTVHFCDEYNSGELFLGTAIFVRILNFFPKQNFRRSSVEENRYNLRKFNSCSSSDDINEDTDDVEFDDSP